MSNFNTFIIAQVDMLKKCKNKVEMLKHIYNLFASIVSHYYYIRNAYLVENALENLKMR
jgi:transcriptional regulator of NAD metabolism